MIYGVRLHNKMCCDGTNTCLSQLLHRNTFLHTNTCVVFCYISLNLINDFSHSEKSVIRCKEILEKNTSIALFLVHTFVLCILIQIYVTVINMFLFRMRLFLDKYFIMCQMHNPVRIKFQILTTLYFVTRGRMVDASPHSFSEYADLS